MSVGVVEMREGDGGFVVSLIPPDPAYPDATFTDRREAWGHAGGIRLLTGREKVDRTS